ncbi:MAG: prolyl oligopeptidase family serine peptidase [Planctomycetaceae bacterium]|nr:prolyl oligopeptidase family serine peptidase [Planctomycetaceae bacterium]
MLDLTWPRVGRFLVTLAWLVSSVKSYAQGTRADYDRAATLRKASEQAVFRDSVQPQWLGPNEFWYRVATGRQRHEFVRVDATTGTREPLVDHARLAGVLSDKLGRAIEADALPLNQLVVEREPSRIRFSADRRRWQCDLNTYEVIELKSDATAAESLPALDAIPSASRATGGDSEITFVNQAAQELRLYWRNLDGRRVAYGTIAAGAERRQHTFAGHAWEVTDLDHRPWVGFVAGIEPVRALIPPDRRIADKPQNTPRSTDPHRSPDGRYSVRFRDHNVVLVSQADGAMPAGDETLTRDGKLDDAYQGPVLWSPDSKQFVVRQIRPPQTHKVHIVESSPADQLQPKLITLDYLKPGDRIAHPRPRLFDVASKQSVSIDESQFANPWSIDDLRWDRDSRRFTFLYNQRGHQVLRVLAVDNAGRVTTIVEERSPTFIDYNAKRYLHRLDETRELLWMSERDGWNHLWLYDAERGQVKHAVTHGSWVVRRVEHVDETRRQVWFLAGGVRPEQDPYYLHLCRVNFDGTGLVVLTAGDGTHEVSFSPQRDWFIDKWSRVDQPPITELRRASDGQLVCELERADAQSLLATGWTMPERFVAPGRDGETDIHGIIIRPANFDPSKRYPVVEQIYAGPHGAHVPKAFGTLTNQHFMAELGFILVQIDGMGTNWRSKKFHDVCWQNLADAGFPDRIAWLKQAAKSRPWMDLDRVGIYGGSAGGQNAMRALIDHHAFYKVAVADCGCHDNRMDKIWWNELWMGHPVGPHYAASSNAEHAHKLQGKLLLIVGELDRNVDPASTMQVVRKLQQADKDFELLVIAGAGHGAAETPYGSRRRADFLVRHLWGREPRAE